MTSTLCIRKTPTPTKDVLYFKLPVKQWIARQFYDHDGSLGGGTITVGQEHLGWFEGCLAAGRFDDAGERRDFEKVVEILRAGGTIDMWFEV